MSAYTSIESHRSMIFDEVRNRAYQRALQRTVRPGCTVLDLGAGLGIHGLMAAKLGAERVFLVDPSPVVRQALELAKRNGVADRVEIIRGRIEEIDLPAPVDVIVSVLTGNFLLDEDLLPSLFQARDRFLAPGGVLVPDQARMKAALVSAEAFHAKHVAGWAEPTLGLDFSPMRTFAANEVYFHSARHIDAKLMSDPVELRGLDLAAASRADCRARVRMPVTLDGECHGLLGWFDMRLGDEWVSTGPVAEAMHWSPAFLPLDPALNLSAGEEIEFELDRPEFGEWTWTISKKDVRQRHSTFQSQLADPGLLKRQSPGSAPGLGQMGELALFVLSQMSAGRTVAEIETAARKRFSDLAERDRRIGRFIHQLVAQWSMDQDET